MDSDILRRINADPNLISFDTQDGHFDVFANRDGLADSSSKN
jgi:hypothetical protein